jgi:hypothetical protein
LIERFQTIITEDKNPDLLVPPGFKHLSNDHSTSSCDSQSIDGDTESVSIFESAHSDYESESIYVECREDLTIINEPNRIKNPNNNTQLEWRNRPRPQWNSNKVKYQKKNTVNPNKAPLSAEKKKNSKFKEISSQEMISISYSSMQICCWWELQVSLLPDLLNSIPSFYFRRGNTLKTQLPISYFILGSQCRFIHVV